MLLSPPTHISMVVGATVAIILHVAVVRSTQTRVVAEHLAAAEASYRDPAAAAGCC